MPFVSMTELLQDALARNYALPAFNIWTYQDVLAYVRAAPFTLLTSDIGCLEN